MTEDLFEAARRAFFGTERVTSEPSASPLPLQPRNEPSQESGPPSLSSDDYEDIKPLISF
jgi:hypothetical protein